MKNIKLISLFAGIGAMEFGAYKVYKNVEIIAAAEIDKYARISYMANHNIDESKFYSDVKLLDGKKYKNKYDCLCFGFPCQDYSIAGLRAGLDGQKGTLFYEAARILKDSMPSMFIAENVKGLMSSNKGKDFKVIISILRNIGYHVHYEVLNTKDYGVPQNRERIFLVGFKNSDHYHNFSFAPKIKLEKRLKDILESDVDEKYYLSDKMIEGFTNHKDKHQKKGTGFIRQPKDENDIANCLRANAALCPTDNTIKVGFINQDTQASAVFNTDGLSPTLCAGTHGYAQGYIKEPNCTPIGMLDIKGNDSIKRVYDSNGLSQTLTTMEGGNIQPKIRIPYADKRGYKEVGLGDTINLSFVNNPNSRGTCRTDGIANTLDTACNQASIGEDLE